MGNIKSELQKILTNKNTLTIIIVLIGIIGIYVVYNMRVNQAITMVKVPYAKKELTSRDQITQEYIGYTEVPKNIASSLGILTSANKVLGNYVNYGYTIPENSFFYPSAVVDFAKASTSEFADIPDGYTVYSLEVDLNSTYGNSMYTGNYIDLYVKAESDGHQIIFGRLIEGIKILSVVDSKGNDVFEASSEVRIPSRMFFAVPDNLYQLLKNTEYISGSVKVMPIPRNASYSSVDREAKIDSQYIQNFILSKTVNLNY